jgi:hypothetical protein
VAHVGEELAFRAAAFLGAIPRRHKLGVDRDELRRSCLDLRFEMRLVVLQLDVTLVNLSEHVVEPVDQRADFIATGPFDANGIGLFVGDRSRRRSQAQNWARNKSLQHPRDEKRDDGRSGEHEQDDPAEMPYALLLLNTVRLEIDGAKALAVQHDRPEHADTIVGHRHVAVEARADLGHRYDVDTRAVV